MMVTGDHLLAAVPVAYASGMVKVSSEIQWQNVALKVSRPWNGMSQNCFGLKRSRVALFCISIVVLVCLRSYAGEADKGRLTADSAVCT